MVYLLGIIVIVLILLAVRSLLILIFSMENYGTHRKRRRQLDFSKKKEDESDDLSGFIEKVTEPVIKYVFPKLKLKNLDRLEKDLKMSGWGIHFSPVQFRALSLILKVLGVLIVLLLWNQASVLAILWGAPLLVGIDFLHLNARNSRRSRLMSDFPNFMRIVEGNLSANMPFSKAVEESIKYVNDDWKLILKDFVVQVEMLGIQEALDGLRDEVDLLVVREFVSRVKITLEQGGSAKEGFSKQADRIREMQADAMMVKIGQREAMGVLLTFPLLLAIIVVMGLPLVNSMLNFSTM